MSDKQYYPGSPYQEFFNLMDQNHGLTLTESEVKEIIEGIHKLFQPQPPAVKADDILDDVHQRIIAGQLKGMSLEKAIYTVGYEDGRNEKGAVGG